MGAVVRESLSAGAIEYRLSFDWEVWYGALFDRDPYGPEAFDAVGEVTLPAFTDPWKAITEASGPFEARGDTKAGISIVVAEGFSGG